MKVTINHSSSSYGVPVILADDGVVMDYGDGVRAIQAKTGLSNRELADRCGVSTRTVENWRQGRMPAAAALNVMSTLV